MGHIDIESLSECDLPRHGAYIYATDPTTKVLCICWGLEDGDIRYWTPGMPLDPELVQLLESEILVAHNAQFERLMFEFVIGPDHGYPVPKLEQWRCTATLARARALPGSLGDAARALRLPYQKDKRGAELIQLMSVPPFEHTPELLEEMVRYCAMDVLVERSLWHTLHPLDDFDWDVYHANERINDRGIRVDLDVARAAVPYAQAEQADLVSELTALTGGAISKPRSRKLVSWIHERLPERYQDILIDKAKKSGMSLDKSRIEELAEISDRLPDPLPRVIEVRALASKSSVSKYQAMLDLADPDDHRVRGAYLQFGAGQTGRYSSRGLQVHNLPRACADDPEATLQRMQDGRLHRDVLRVLSSMLRPSIIAATGHTFICADWAGIEARALPWLAGAEHILDVFRRGDDVYIKAASDVWPGETIDKDKRQVGKVIVLALGFGGGVGSFTTMGRNYGVRLPENRVKVIVDRWRMANRWARRFSDALLQAAMHAYDAPGQWFRAGDHIRYIRRGNHLYCELPSGRELMYPWIESEIVENRYGMTRQLSAIKGNLVPAEGNEWPRVRIWHGLLAENVTQATCADLLMDALARADSAGFPVALHTHDEIVLECARRKAAEAQKGLEALMLEAPEWAAGLPLAVESWTGNRYRK
jgi:DNA polymerase